MSKQVKEHKKPEREFAMMYGGYRLEKFNPGKSDERHLIVCKDGYDKMLTGYTVLLPASYSKALMAVMKWVDENPVEPAGEAAPAPKLHKFNENGVCENPDTIELWDDKYFGVWIELGQHAKGWCWGYAFEIKGSMTGCGGSAGGPSLSGKPYETRELAQIDALKRALDWATKKGKHPNGRPLQPVFNHITKLIEMAMPTQPKKDTAPAIAAAPAVDNFTAPLLQHVKLSDITPDPNQPRKMFDERTDKELMDSVREQGILQPILLRPIECSEANSVEMQVTKSTGAKYLVICGERRFRAAKAVQLAMIPAIIRRMNDDEALEAQIVENLQRKDVHPMEEAVAFEQLGKRGLTQEQIGKRVGKGDRFVRARLVLCGLVPNWRELFMRNIIELELALKICRFSPEDQEVILQDQELTQGDIERPDLILDIRDFSKYKGDLTAACFDLTDPNINPAMGACIGCPFNSATSVLFSEDAASKCTNISCFQKKTDHGFKIQLAEAQKSGIVELVQLGYRASDDKKVKKLKDQGMTVLTHSDFNLQTAEDPGTFEDWKERCLLNKYTGYHEYEEGLSPAENRGQYDAAVKQYQGEMADIEKGLAKGKYVRALVVQGDDDDPAGKMIVIEKITRSAGSRSKQSGQPTPAQKVAAGTATDKDLQNEVERLEGDIESIKKKKLDNEHIALVTAYKACPATINNTKTGLTPVEKNCLIFYMLESMGGIEDLVWYADDEDEDEKEKARFSRALGIPAAGANTKNKGRIGMGWAKVEDMDPAEEENRERCWNFLSGLSDGALALVFRRFMVKEYGQVTQMIPSGYNSHKAWILRKMIECFDGMGEGMINIPEISKEIHDKAEVRIKRNKERIKQLKKDIAELQEKKDAKGKKKPESGTKVQKNDTPVAKTVTKGQKGVKKIAPGAFGTHTSKAVEEPEEVQTCRVCGCTEENCIQCVAITGSACSWVGEDICSACVEREAALKWIGIDYDGMDNMTIRDYLITFLDKINPKGTIVKILLKGVKVADPADLRLSIIQKAPFGRLLITEYRNHLKTQADLDKLLGPAPTAQPFGPDHDAHGREAVKSKFPGGDEILKTAGIQVYDDTAHLLTVIDKLPFSGYTLNFRNALTNGTWAWSGVDPAEITPIEAAHKIIDSAEFIALLRIKYKDLTDHEVRNAGLAHGRLSGPYSFKGKKDKAVGGNGMTNETSKAVQDLVEYWRQLHEEDKGDKAPVTEEMELDSPSLTMEVITEAADIPAEAWNKLEGKARLLSPAVKSTWPGGAAALTIAGIKSYEPVALHSFLRVELVKDDKALYPYVIDWMTKLEMGTINPADIIDSDYFIVILRHHYVQLEKYELEAFELTDKQRKQLADALIPLKGPKAMQIRIDNLCMRWQEIKGQQQRLEAKDGAKWKSEQAPDDFTDEERAAWDGWEIGKRQKELGQIREIVKTILLTAKDSNEIKALKKKLNDAKSSSIDTAPKKPEIYVSDVYYGSVIREEPFRKAMTEAWAYVK